MIPSVIIGGYGKKYRGCYGWQSVYRPQWTGGPLAPLLSAKQQALGQLRGMKNLLAVNFATVFHFLKLTGKVHLSLSWTKHNRAMRTYGECRYSSKNS